MEITSHQRDEFNKRITITRNGAGNRYQLYLDRGTPGEVKVELRFQSDALPGFTDEAIAAVLADRGNTLRAKDGSVVEYEEAKINIHKLDPDKVAADVVKGLKEGKPMLSKQTIEELRIPPTSPKKKS